MSVNIVEELLSGPRGRRLCLGYVAASDEAVREAVFWFGHELDPHPGTLFRIGGDDTGPIEEPTFTEAEVAARIDRVELGSVSTKIAREALGDTVALARYWQEPDGVDMVATLPAVQEALVPVARLLAAELPDLENGFATNQWAADWRVPSDSTPIERNPAAVLSAWTLELKEDEERSARDRPADPHARWSGTWWSVPTQLLESRGRLADALELVEDFSGWDDATVIPVVGSGRILEIASADDWADLCREYPMEVTASRRHDWFRVTGRDGRWLIPDWQRVAQRWDAVHLTMLGYLSSATKLIAVDSEYATVIAGWGPDSTIWLNDVARESGEPRLHWRRNDDNTWVLVETLTS